MVEHNGRAKKLKIRIKTEHSKNHLPFPSEATA